MRVGDGIRSLSRLMKVLSNSSGKWRKKKPFLPFPSAQFHPLILIRSSQLQLSFLSLSLLFRIYQLGIQPYSSRISSFLSPKRSELSQFMKLRD